MKKITLFALLIAGTIFCNTVAAQESTDKPTEVLHTEKTTVSETKNILTVSISPVGFSSYSNFFMNLGKIDYGRRVARNFYLGASVGFYRGRGATATCISTPDRNDVTTISAMAYYLLPVVGEKIQMRFGAGAGVGIHDFIADYDDTRSVYALPYFTAEITWVFRYSEKVRINVSPLIVSPSQVLLSPMSAGNYSGFSYILDVIRFGVSMTF